MHKNLEQRLSQIESEFSAKENDDYKKAKHVTPAMQRPFRPSTQITVIFMAGFYCSESIVSGGLKPLCLSRISFTKSIMSPSKEPTRQKDKIL